MDGYDISPLVATIEIPPIIMTTETTKQAQSQSLPQNSYDLEANPEQKEPRKSTLRALFHLGLLVAD